MGMVSISELPKYEAYKDSGIDWIGDVPANWDLVPIRSIFKFRNEKNDPVRTEEILSLSIANGVTQYSEEGRGGNKRKDDLSAYKLAHPGDIVLNSMNVIVGAVGMSKFFGAISPVYYALYNYKNDDFTNYYEKIFLNEGFQRGLLKFGKGILIKLSGTGKLNTIRMKISTDDLKTLYFPKPSLSEQKLISDYLDKKATQIDEAIAIKEQQIALLKERKQIIIQKAVTQGLDPNMPMKDSGVDWIGQIPAHWEVIKLKHLFKEVTSRTKTGSETLFSLRMEIGLVPHNDVSDKHIPPESLVDYKIVECGQMVMNRMRAAIGIFGLATDYGLVSPDYAVFDVAGDVVPDYYLTLFKLPLLGTQFRLASKGMGTGSSGFMRLYTDEFGDIKVANPPKEEQEALVRFIAETNRATDLGVDHLQSQIAKLKEYKTTLINSAVTGKIKITPEMAGLNREAQDAVEA